LAGYTYLLVAKVNEFSLTLASYIFLLVAKVYKTI